MRLEGLVTCLDAYENPEGRIALVGLFQDLPSPPDRFAIYFDLRPGAEESASVRVRVRNAGKQRNVLFETHEELVLSPLVKNFAGVAFVDQTPIPAAKLVVEVVVNGSTVGSRLINFKP